MLSQVWLGHESRTGRMWTKLVTTMPDLRKKAHSAEASTYDWNRKIRSGQFVQILKYEAYSCIELIIQHRLINHSDGRVENEHVRTARTKLVESDDRLCEWGCASVCKRRGDYKRHIRAKILTDRYERRQTISTFESEGKQQYENTDEQSLKKQLWSFLWFELWLPPDLLDYGPTRYHVSLVDDCWQTVNPILGSQLTYMSWGNRGSNEEISSRIASGSQTVWCHKNSVSWHYK